MTQLRTSDILELMIERLPEAAAVFDTKMRYAACNSSWLSKFRLTSDEVIGRSHYTIFPETSDGWKDYHARAQAGETLSSDMETCRAEVGSPDGGRWELVPWHRPSGEIGGIIMFADASAGSADDHISRDLLSAELDLLIENAHHHAIFLLDEDGAVRTWNAGAQRMFGWSAAEIVGRPHTLLFRSVDSDLLDTDLLVQASLHQGRFRGRLDALNKDGSQFTAGVILEAVKRRSGAMARHVVAVHDLSGEIEQAQSVAASEAYHRAILETVPDAMITIDEQGSILWFSQAAERLFGYRAAEVIGHNVSMLMPESEAIRHDKHLANYRDTGSPTAIGKARRVFGRRKDGTLFPHDLFIGEANGGGRRVFTGFLRDLSQQEEAERQVRELQSELVHMSRVLAVGTMAGALAHELNQPLTAIANYVQTSAALLAETSDELLSVVCQALDLAGKEALRAGGIIHRLREFVARGELERSIVAPADLIAQALGLGAVGTNARDIAHTVTVPQNLPNVLVDRVQVQQVLLNLIRNAIEAMGDHGQLQIDGRQTGDMIRFAVSDNGPGVTPGQEEAIFEPFISGNTSGLGMGLAICRTIINAHGGTMWCEHRSGGGATFFFTVPVAEASDV